MSAAEYIEQEIPSKSVYAERCTIKEGTRFFLRIPASLMFYAKRVDHQFIWRNGTDEWVIPHGSFITPATLPYRHKSKPIDRMIKHAQGSEGFRPDDAKHLLRLLAEDFFCRLGWMPSGWMMCDQPYLWIDLRSMDKPIGRYKRDGDEPHPFLTRQTERAA